MLRLIPHTPESCPMYTLSGICEHVVSYAFNTRSLDLPDKLSFRQLEDLKVTCTLNCGYHVRQITCVDSMLRLVHACYAGARELGLILRLVTVTLSLILGF